jgi:hypothetical protein
LIHDTTTPHVAIDDEKEEAIVHACGEAVFKAIMTRWSTFGV